MDTVAQKGQDLPNNEMKKNKNDPELQMVAAPKTGLTWAEIRVMERRGVWK